MHPGNIFVSEEGQYRAIDFGIMGTLGDEDKRYLAENFLAFFHRDYRAVAEAHLRAGWVPPHTRVEEFEAAIRTVCEPIFAKPISEISFGRLVMQLFQTARRFDMPVQPQLVLLQKTLLNIEGLGRRLYPELDLWETAKPYLERWMSEQVGYHAFVAGMKRELPRLGAILPDMPRLAHAWLEHAAQDANTRKREIEVLQDMRRDVGRSQRRHYYATVGSVLVLGALVVSGLDGYAPVMIGNVPLLSWVVGGIGAALLALSWPRR
jgi:ubiquinone biosynthesis protein